MKITLAAVTALTGLLVVESASAATQSYKATLNGAQQVPAVTTTATGTADLTFDDVTKRLTGKITISIADGDVDGQHIHREACGKSSANLIPLPNPNNKEITLAGNDVELDAAEEADLVAGKMYVNIHTGAHASGEIRGQLFKDGIGTCPAGAADAGADSGTTSSSGGSSGTASSSGGSSSGGSSSGGSSGATTTRPDSGTETAAAADDDSGCSTSGQNGSSSTNGVLVALGAAIAVTGFARGRRNKKK